MTADGAPDRLSPPDAARGVLRAVERGETVALLVVVSDPSGRMEGRRMLVTADDSRGSLGDPDLDRAARELGRRAVEADAGVDEGVHVLTGGPEADVRTYLEVHHPEPELVVVGAGHIARPLCTVGDLLGFRVLVLDDRPDFATRERFPEAERVLQVDFSNPFQDVRIHPLSHLILVTRGHKYDYECLRRVLRLDPGPGYIGMIGSRRRVRATYTQLLEEEIPRERIADVHAPVGLDVGAETPAEIAVAVAGEIVLRWRGGTGRPLRDEERVLERFFPEDAEKDASRAAPPGPGDDPTDRESGG